VINDLSVAVRRFLEANERVIAMKMPKVGLDSGLRVLSGIVFGYFALVILRAAPQATTNSKEQAREELERLIYSVKGPDLFRAHCAPCHGLEAKGNGILSRSLKTKPADLTVLAKNNGGKFPAARVQKTITGEDVVASHGTREMPIWGPIFHQVEQDQDFGNVRIQNLLGYLETIQQK
jgi:mono/diheme cytochrome c family protein